MKRLILWALIAVVAVAVLAIWDHYKTSTPPLRAGLRYWDAEEQSFAEVIMISTGEHIQQYVGEPREYLDAEGNPQHRPGIAVPPSLMYDSLALCVAIPDTVIPFIPGNSARWFIRPLTR